MKKETKAKKTNSKKIEHPKYEELIEKLTAAEQKANEHWNDMLRAKAELENMQKRVERDIANAHKYALEKFAIELLPIIDSMELGLVSCANKKTDVVNGILNGIQLTLELFLKTLQKFNIKQIDPLGKLFDPELHEAMTIKEDTSVKPDTVVEVLQKGYQLNDRLIRPALVVVAANGE